MPKEKYMNAHELNKRIVLFAPILYFFILLLTAYHSFKKPEYNWDMLPYMALVLKADNADIKIIHDLTYQIAKKKLPPSTYQNLTSANAYRKKMSEDAVAFNNQLPFYVVKPLYISVVYLFYKCGFSLTASTILPSIFAFLLCGTLLYYWLKKHIRVLFASGLALFVMLSPPILSVARLSTPDALSALFLLSSFYFILEKPRIIPLFSLLVFSVFTRLDNIITCSIIISLLSFSNKSLLRISVTKYALAILFLAICYFIITSNATKYGWSIFYYDSFAHYTNQLHGLNDHFSLKNNLHLIIAIAFDGLYYSNIIILFAMIFVLFMKPKLDSFGNLSFDQLFSLSIVLIIFFRFILFQDISDRYYTSFYLVSVALLTRKLINHKSLSNQNDRA